MNLSEYWFDSHAGFGLVNGLCQACIGGYSSAEGLTTACTICAAGSFAAAQSAICNPCSTNMVAASGSTTCTACPVGQIVAPQTTSCTCAKGSSLNSDGACV